MKIASRKKRLLKDFLRACECAFVLKEDGQIYFVRPPSAEKIKNSNYCYVAYPLHSGGGDGPEAFFQGFRVARAEIVKRTKKSITLYVFEILRDDAPELQPDRLLLKRLDDGGRFKDPLFIVLSPEKLRRLNLWKN